jgi:hypothetical protein
MKLDKSIYCDLQKKILTNATFAIKISITTYIKVSLRELE